MIYFMKRVSYAITHRKSWLLLAFFPPLVFLASAVFTPDRFIVAQDISLRPDKVLTPIEIHSMVSSGLFKDQVDGRYAILRSTPVREVFFIVNSPSSVRIAYEGSSVDAGVNLVAHYSDRLQRNLLNNRELGLGSPSEIARGTLVVEELRALWRAERLRPLSQYAVVSFFLAILILLAMEFFDPSFKSERAAARYLGVPILGSVPSADSVLEAMGKSDKTMESGLSQLDTAAQTRKS